MENNSTLDQDMLNARNNSPGANLANGWKRFANSIIDTICYYVLMFVIAFIFGIMNMHINADNGFIYLLAFGTFFIYYIVLEASLGKTIGKMITGTKVVDLEGNKITFSKASGRTICRFIPFDGLSFFGSRSYGWHDSISKTCVINDY